MSCGSARMHDHRIGSQAPYPTSRQLTQNRRYTCHFSYVFSLQFYRHFSPITVVATHTKPASSRLPASFMHQSLVCTHCQNTAMLFNTITELVKHMKITHPLAAYYVCCLCFRMFKYQSAIVKHFRVAHTIDSTYKCLKRCHALVMPLNCDSHMFLVNDIPKGEGVHSNSILVTYTL